MFVQILISHVVSVPSEPVPAVEVTLVPGNNILLPCRAASNLAQVRWFLSERRLPLRPDPRYDHAHGGGLLLLNASPADAGLYACVSVERLHGGVTYNRTVAVYRLALSPAPGGTVEEEEVEDRDGGVLFVEATDSSNCSDIPSATPGVAEGPLGPETQTDAGGITGLRVAVGVLALLSLSLFTALIWKVKGWGLSSGCLPWSSGSGGSSRESQAKTPVVEYTHVPNHHHHHHQGLPEMGVPEPGSPCIGNNNHNHNHSAVDFKGNGHPHFTSMASVSCLEGLGYINDESEI